MPQIENHTDMDAFLHRHMILWEKKPRAWDDGPFIGGGLMGSSLYFNSRNHLTLTIGDTGIYDNRPETEKETNKLFLTPRLPIGEFHIGGVVGAASMQLDLYNAIAYGWSKTIVGTYKYKCFSPHGKRLIIFETFRDFTDCRIDWVAADIESPRQRRLSRLKSERASEDYPAPHKPYSYQHRDVNYCIFPLFSGGYYVLAYKVVKLEDGVRMFITIGEGSREHLITRQLAYELENAVAKYDSILQEHLSYWHDFYSKSFVSLSDAATEEFYWIQLYKLASAGCENGRIYDTCGPWLTNNTAWPGAWWNLNVQLTYSPLFASNHLELVKPLLQTLYNGMEELIDNVPPEYRCDSAAIGRNTTATLRSPAGVPGDLDANSEVGNLLWALHSVWLFYRMKPSRSMVNRLLFPLLRRAVSYYLHFLLLDDDGILHIPPTLSPEYPKIGSDMNYDLSLLKWGLQTLLSLCNDEEIFDEKQEEWRWVLDHLAAYPVEEGRGFMIAADVPYEISHRHYSHLLMIYPLHTLDLTNEENRALAEASIAYWQSKPEALQGYSQTGAASMYACLGDGESAYIHLSKLWTDGYIRPNTMYHEGGSPVLETPCAAACTILDMLLQSYGDTIRIFPAIPSVWTDICVADLLCEGGFTVSAVQKNGELQWVSLANKSEKDACVTLTAPFAEEEPLVLYANEESEPVQMPKTGLRLFVPHAQQLILAKEQVESFEIKPVSMTENNCHVYGYNKDSFSAYKAR